MSEVSFSDAAGAAELPAALRDIPVRIFAHLFTADLTLEEYQGQPT